MTVEAPQAEIKSEAEKGTERLFRYSEYVHVGEGADECPFAVAVSYPREKDAEPLPLCTDPDHFHAWVRIANPFQIRDIQEKAQAARARRARAYRDPDSDVSAILDSEIDQLRGLPKDVLADELVDQDFPEHYTQAMLEVMDAEVPDYEPKDDEDAPKLYAHIEQDREEYERQRALLPEQREEDYDQLEKTIADFGRALEDGIKQLQGPKREALMTKPEDELLKLIREARVDQSCMEVYLHTFNMWQWFVCTYKPVAKGRPRERYFRDINEMKYETAPEVAPKLKEAFGRLESELAQSRAAKNS